MDENGGEPKAGAHTKYDKFCDKFNINPNLFMLKISLFVLYGATSSLLPYLSIHIQSIGITVEEMSVIYLALPFTTFLAPPLTGFLVDKFGQYKPVVIISFVLNAVFHHALLLIPHQETPGVVPAAYVMHHPDKGDVEVWWSPCRSRECPDEEELDIALDNCLDHCLLRAGRKEDFRPPGEKDDLKLHVEKKPNKPSKRKNRTSAATASTTELVFFVVDMHPDLGEPVEQIGIEIEQDESVIDFQARFGDELLHRSGVNITALEEDDLRCGGIVLNSSLSYRKKMERRAGECVLQRCSFSKGGPGVCPPDYKESDDRIFWIYFVLRFMGSIALSAGVTMMDPIALTMIEKYGGDFGRERLFSSMGMAIFSPITGVLIDIYSKAKGYTDYSAAFYTYDILLAISAVTVFLMPLGAKLPADNIFKDLLNLVKMPHILLFIFFIYTLGNFWGFIESYLFLYLKELGSPNYLLGITVTVGTVSSMPFLYGAERITKQLGHVSIIVIAFFAHAVRLVGYSYIENAWWCFPFEALESLSVHLMWVAAATYCALLAPKNLLATLIGIVGMAHFSIGRGSGSFIGGRLIEKEGIQEAFRSMGTIALVAGSVYGFLHLVWLRNIKVFLPEKAEDVAENQEAAEKMLAVPDEPVEPKFKDQATMVSVERLHIMVEYNQIGSLSSLKSRIYKDLPSAAEHPYIGRTRSSSIRRGSYSLGMFKSPKSSSSKVDVGKSTQEVAKQSSIKTVAEQKTSSAPKLNPRSLPSIANSIEDTERETTLEKIDEATDEKCRKDNAARAQD